jgi:hypothetical protein
LRRRTTTTKPRNVQGREREKKMTMKEKNKQKPNRHYTHSSSCLVSLEFVVCKKERESVRERERAKHATNNNEIHTQNKK